MKPLSIGILILVSIQSMLDGSSILVSVRLCSSIGVENKINDALSHIGCLLHTMRVEVIGFDRLKGTYSSCPNFGPIYSDLLASNRRSNVDFVLQEVIYFEVLNYAFLELHLGTF